MQVIIDRIEGEQAVVELPDMTTVSVPLSLFPGVKEGDVYQIIKDDGAATKRKARIQGKFNELKKNKK